MLEVSFFWERPLPYELLGASWSAAFNKVFDSDLWRWWLEGNPLIDKILAAYILDGETVACFYTVSPRTLLSPSGNILKSGLMNAGFTHPQFQGRGYYLQINRALHEKLREMDFDCIFGFANHNSHYSYRRYLGWEDVGLLTNFQLRRKLVKKNCFAQPATCSEVIPLSQDILYELASFQVTGERFHIQRGYEYLDWRLRENPNRNYRCLATRIDGQVFSYTVFKTFGNNEADVMEIFYRPEASSRQEELLTAITGSFLDAGVEAINLWSNLYSDEHLVLEKIGFREAEANTYFGVIDFGYMPGLSQCRNWHYRFIDSDLY